MSTNSTSKKETIQLDLTPRWVDIIGFLAEQATNGNTPAREELKRAAQLADYCKDLIKQRDELRAKLELCEAVLGASPTHCNQHTGEAVSELLKGVREAIKSSK